ncbi:MAG TPA: Flp pilus assembly complex ATPase component TadA, partial [Candidatus Hydrogenedentes bacterium]|nr:Flp pilus assembly complex ATPase component TadA [Candidatus Hydrogenedentota bacterium]
YQRGFIEGTFHAIDQYIPTVTELELPDIVHTLALSDSGLVLVTGMTGSGKSSTIASMVGVINENTSKVVVTIEDPIEYVHENALSIVKQREVGNDTLSCLRALRHALRQDPDVLVIDTVPDLGTMDTALRAAEEGYLIIMSFPTPDPPRTLSRIATMYPQAQRALVLHMLAGALRGVISQKLLPRLDGSGSALACEVLVANDAIRGAIRSDRMEDQMMSIMGSVPGAQLLDVNLRRLVQRGEISYETAALVAHNPEILRRR